MTDRPHAWPSRMGRTRLSALMAAGLAGATMSSAATRMRPRVMASAVSGQPNRRGSENRGYATRSLHPQDAPGLVYLAVPRDRRGGHRTRRRLPGCGRALVTDQARVKAPLDTTARHAESPSFNRQGPQVYSTGAHLERGILGRCRQSALECSFAKPWVDCWRDGLSLGKLCGLVAAL